MGGGVGEVEAGHCGGVARGGVEVHIDTLREKAMKWMMRTDCWTSWKGSGMIEAYNVNLLAPVPFYCISSKMPLTYVLTHIFTLVFAWVGVCWRFPTQFSISQIAQMYKHTVILLCYIILIQSLFSLFVLIN